MTRSACALRAAARATARSSGGLLALGACVAGGLACFTWRTARRVEAALPAKGHFADIDGARIHYTDTGTGPAIVMIHGLGGQLRNFGYDELTALARDFRVIGVDRPGSGYSTRERSASATIAAQAASLAAVIRELGMERPLLVGHSLGGAVALAIALNHPDCAGGLALIAPLTHRQATTPSVFRVLAIRSALVRFLVAWTIATPAAIRTRDAVLRTLFGPDPVPADFAIKSGALLGLRPSSFYSASSDLVAANADLSDMEARYASLRIPVGILYGTGDRVLDHVVNGRAMDGKIPGLELELIEQGGRMTPMSAPARPARFIRRIAARIKPDI